MQRHHPRARHAIGGTLRFLGATLMLLTALAVLAGAGFLAYRAASQAIEVSSEAAIGRFVLFFFGTGVGGPLVFGVGGGIAGSLLFAGSDRLGGDTDGFLSFGGICDSGGLLDLGGLASDIGAFASDIGAFASDIGGDFFDGGDGGDGGGGG